MIVQRSLVFSINSTIIVLYCGSTVIGTFIVLKKIATLNVGDYNLNLVNVIYTCTTLYYNVQYVIRKVIIVILIIILYVTVITYKK